MTPPTPRGIFITVEGIDGAGKTTQARRLAAWLERRGHRVLLTREPGATALGEQLRRLILNGRAGVAPTAELLLYAADRAQHVEEVLAPALARGQTVICERYADSTVAYQGYGRGLDLGLVRRLNRLATRGLEPDLTLLLDLAPRAARRRLAGAPDRLEREGAGFHRRVCEGYRQLAAAHPRRIRVVAARGAPERVFGRAAEVVETFLAKRRRP